jgi:hypothetical protein
LLHQNEFIRELKIELNNSNIKVKDLQSAIQAEMESHNEGVSHIIYIYDTIIQDSIKAFEIDDGYLKLNAKIVNDSIPWKYIYTENLIYFDYFSPCLFKNNGKKRAALWVWLFPKKQPKIKIKSLNPHSVITATKTEII